jgi:hypothetical protein
VITRLQSFDNLQAFEFAATQVVPTAGSRCGCQGGRGIFIRAERGSLPGDPSCAFAPFQDPGRTDDPSPLTVSSVLPLPLRKQRLQRHGYIEANARLRHLLSTLPGGCYHCPGKNRFRLAGSPLPGGS